MVFFGVKRIRSFSNTYTADANIDMNGFDIENVGNLSGALTITGDLNMGSNNITNVGNVTASGTLTGADATLTSSGADLTVNATNTGSGTRIGGVNFLSEDFTRAMGVLFSSDTTNNEGYFGTVYNGGGTINLV